MDAATLCLIPVAAIGGSTIATWIIDAVKSRSDLRSKFITIKCRPCDIDRQIDRREDIYRAIKLAFEFGADHANCTAENPLFGRACVTKEEE